MNLGLFAARVDLNQLVVLDNYVERTCCFENDYRGVISPRGILNPFERIQTSLMKNQMTWIHEAYRVAFRWKRRPEAIDEGLSYFSTLKEEKCADSIELSPDNN